MLNQEQLRTLAESRGDYLSQDPPAGSWWAELAGRRQAALDSLGRPPDEQVVASALPLLADAERNRRVMALRVLGWYRERPDVAAAIVAASHDPVRRVRRIALKLLRPDRPEEAARLLQVARDPREYHRIRTEALVRLARQSMSEEVVAGIRSLLDHQTERRRVLVALLGEPLDEATGALLEHIVRVGTKEEAVAATRRLCGYLLVRSDNWRPPSAQPADISWAFTPGSLMKADYARFYWVPTDRLPAEAGLTPG